MPYHRTAHCGKVFPSGRSQVLPFDESSLDDILANCRIPPQYNSPGNLEKSEIEAFYLQFPLEELYKIDDSFRYFYRKYPTFDRSHQRYITQRSEIAHYIMYRLSRQKQEEMELAKKEDPIPIAQTTEKLVTTNATEPDQYLEPSEEPSASETKPQTENPKEPPIRKRKRNNNKNSTNVDSTKHTNCSSDPLTSPVKPTPVPMETPEESTEKVPEPSTNVHKAQPPKNLKVLIRGLPLYGL
nr:uncharacterized protein LOC122272805 [Parasteatoda tepidariorum]XP_042912746.1 uncharacterized protein LOC122272805 [Parasteatoda tepidariorum]